MSEDITLPFKLDEVYNGIAEGDGLLRWDGFKLIIEYQVKDSIFGVLKSSIKRFGVRMEDLQEISISKSFFSCYICIKSHSLYTFNNFPGRKMNEIKLKIKKSELDAARQLSSSVQLAISEKKLDNLSN